MTDNESIAVQFDRVSKSYDGVSVVVDELSLGIHEGEFLTMLGPSGSGKTTCLMMLVGFEVPTSGDISLRGQSLKTVPPYDRNIGMVFQNYALFPHMTVAENLAFPLSARGCPKHEIQDRISKALEMVKLANLGDRRPAQLSGGQQQRVAVARSLVYEPTLVLMDEPLGALDKQLREQMQLELKHIHQTIGVTIVYVTHDQSEALTMSDRVAVFNDGKIQQLSGPEDLYERPDNVFVAEFIGENNRLSGTVKHVSGEICKVDVGEGILINALPVNIGAVGSKTTVSLRPEAITLNPKKNSANNQFSARVLETIYHGDHIRLRIELFGKEDFVIKVPRSHVPSDLKVGSTCVIGWNSDDCRALDASVAQPTVSDHLQ